MRVYLRTFGCRANHYDTETARAMIERAGHAIVADAAEADVAVFNSCAVTSQAEADLRQAVRRAHRLNPSLSSVVMGCAAALEHTRPAERRLSTLPGVHAVIPAADLEALAASPSLSKAPAA